VNTVREVRYDKTYGDLEFCPFCDSTRSVRVIERYDDQTAYDKQYQVTCSLNYGGCGSYSGICDGKGAMQKAVDLWNRKRSQSTKECCINGDTSIFKASPPTQTAGKLTIPIDELDLTVRSYNCLKRANINTIEDLIKLTELEVIKLKNLGYKSFEEIVSKLAVLGLSLIRVEA